LAGIAEWIAVDWGTSNLRAWGIDAAGEVVFSRSSDQGMGKLTPDAYPGVLTSLLSDAVSETAALDILICGMAGARQGWLEAPYLEAPANLAGLAFRGLSPAVPGTGFKPTILPGVCQKLAGNEDVMRGEETQLLGLSALSPGFSGLVVMPGTHSKWVTLAGSRIERFSTAMTGELYDLLRTHSVLRHSLQGSLDGDDRDAGLEAGLDSGLEAPQRLTATLFKVRAGSLLSGRSAPWCAGFLSGLLIGAEIGGQRDWITGEEIPLVGGTGLCQLYARAFAMLGAKTRIVDATDATLAGLRAARAA
jgi:2-dehydro-3-deoxygalactonokinase